MGGGNVAVDRGAHRPLVILAWPAALNWALLCWGVGGLIDHGLQRADCLRDVKLC
jgi:hypothetical protein